MEEELDRTNLALLSQIEQKVDMMLRELDKNTMIFMQEPELERFLDINYSSVNLYENYFTLNDKIKALMYANKNVLSVYLYSFASQRILTDLNEDKAASILGSLETVSRRMNISSIWWMWRPAVSSGYAPIPPAGSRTAIRRIRTRTRLSPRTVRS